MKPSGNRGGNNSKRNNQGRRNTTGKKPKTPVERLIIEMGDFSNAFSFEELEEHLKKASYCLKPERDVHVAYLKRVLGARKKLAIVQLNAIKFLMKKGDMQNAEEVTGYYNHSLNEIERIQRVIYPPKPFQ